MMPQNWAECSQACPATTAAGRGLFGAVGGDGWGRGGFVVAVVGHQVFEEGFAIGVFGAPAGHLVEFAIPRGAGKSLRVDQAHAVAGDAGARLFLLAAVERRLVGGPSRECEGAGDQSEFLHAFSTRTPTRSMAFHK